MYNLAFDENVSAGILLFLRINTQQPRLLIMSKSLAFKKVYVAGQETNLMSRVIKIGQKSSLFVMFLNLIM